MKYKAAIVQVAGIATLATGCFFVSTTVGLLVTGVLITAMGVALEREKK